MPTRSHPLANEIADRVRAGDERAYETLVRTYADDLCRFAAIMLGEMSDAEDVVQDVFVQVWSHRATLPGAEQLQAYLYRATRNRAIDVLRHQRTVQAHATRVQVLGESSADAGDDDRALHDELVHAKAALTDRQRLVLILRYEQGHTHAEVAHILGVSLRGAEQLAQRALHILRGRMQR